MGTLLLLCFLSLVVLLVCWLIARFTLVAHSSRLSAGWLAGHFAYFSSPLAVLAKQCQTGCLTLLRWPVKCLPDDEPYNYPVALLFRLLCLGLSLPIWLGEFPIARLRSAAFFHLTPTLLHLPLDIPLGLLWVLVPVAWALLLAEAIGLLSTSELWQFPQLQTSRWLRLVVSLFALVGFLSALVLSFGFSVYGQCILIADCQTAAGLELLIAGGFQVLLITTGIATFMCLLLGLCGVSALLLLVLWCACAFIARLCALCAGSLQGLGTIAQDLHESAHLPPYQRGRIDLSHTPIFRPPPVRSLRDYPELSDTYRNNGKKGKPSL